VPVLAHAKTMPAAAPVKQPHASAVLGVNAPAASARLQRSRAAALKEHAVRLPAQQAGHALAVRPAIARERASPAQAGRALAVSKSSSSPLCHS
jgi:hypothetical protein